MASVNWWPYLLILLVFSLITRVYPLAAFAVMLILISAAARAWSRRALQLVTYQRKLIYERGFPGEMLTLSVIAENRKFLPVPWLRVIDMIPEAVGPQDERLLQITHLPEMGALVNLYSLRWFERDRRIFTLLLRQRGIYRLGPTALEAGDIFGLFENRRDDENYDYLTVFPEPLDFEDLGLPASDPFGEQRARRRLYEDPNLMMGVRAYQPEDDFRRVHWPATARTGELQVKVYQPVSARVMVICLNVMTMPHYWDGANPALLEYLTRVAAAVAQRALADGYRVGLISNTCLAHADQPFRVPPGRSPDQLARLLTALAGTTLFVTSTFDRFLLHESPRLPYGATLVLITGQTSQELREAAMRLRQRGRRVVLLSFDERKPLPVPGVTLIHRPFHP